MKVLQKIIYLWTGSIVFCAIAVYLLFRVDNWLVVDNNPDQTDAIVVLGGGGASRLRKGISLYDQGFSESLILIDDKVSDWTYLMTHLCRDCHLEGKHVDILVGSTSTFTDARLVKEYCLLNRIKSIIVITDPYHTRRVLITFRGYFKASSILYTVVSSGDYGLLLAPGNGWWRDKQTLKTVLLEFTKTLYVLCASFFKATIS